MKSKDIILSLVIVVSAALISGCGLVAADDQAAPTAAAPTEPPTEPPTVAPTPSPALGNGMPVHGWYGRVLEDDPEDLGCYRLLLLPEGTGEVRVRGADVTIQAELEALRGSKTPAHVSGELVSDLSSSPETLLYVDEVRAVGSETLLGAEIAGWQGIIFSTPEGAQFDDYLQLTGEFPIRYGIEGANQDVAAELESVRDSLTPVKLWGTLTCGVIDVNGCQLEARRVLLIGEPLAPTPVSEQDEGEPVEGWIGTIVDLPAGNQFGQKFAREDGQSYHLGTPTHVVREQLVEARSTGAQVRVWGTLFTAPSETEAQTIVLDRVEILTQPDEEGQPVEGWVGHIVDLPAGHQFGQEFVREDGQSYHLGTPTDIVRGQVVEARSTGAQVRVWGILYVTPSESGQQTIVLDRVEVLAQSDDEGEPVKGWSGTIYKLPAGNQFGQTFVRDGGEQYTIGASDETMRTRIADAAWTGDHVRVDGRLHVGVPAAEARHIEVEELTVLSSAAPEARDLTPFAAVSASSFLPADQYGSYGPYAAVDSAKETSWVEGTSGPGIGEWIELSFPETFLLHSLTLDVGFDASEDLFVKNNRVKRATVLCSSGGKTAVEFDDVRGLQEVTVVPASGPICETTSVRIIIDEVYPGIKYDDTCLAEIQVWGAVP